MTKDEKTAYWRQQVDGFQASGLSAKNYCAQEGIAVATCQRRFKSDTPPLHLPTAYAAGAVSRLAFTIPAAR